MRATISEKYRSKFSPSFPTVIMGRIVKVTLGEAEKNPEKWINSPIGAFYDDHQELREQIQRRAKKPVVIKLDMNNADVRGNLFAEGVLSKKEQAVKKFEEAQKLSIARMQKRHGANQAKAKDQEKKNKAAIARAVKAEKAKATA